MTDTSLSFPHHEDRQEFKEALAYNFDFSADDFLHMVRQKLSVPGNGPIDVSLSRKRQLTQQAKTHLKAVLRPSDYSRFDIDSSFRIVSRAAEYLESSK